MKKTFIILCTWEKKIGIGHVKRSESLAKSILDISKGISITIFLNNIEELPNFIKFPSEVKLRDINKLNSDKFVKDLNCQMIIFDIIEEFRDEYINKLITKKIPKVLISDSQTSDSRLKKKDFNIIINGNPALKEKCKIEHSVLYMEGIKYFIVDPYYKFCYEERKQALENLKKNNKKIIITVGGTDHNNILRDLLKNISEVFNHYSMDVYTSDLIKKEFLENQKISNINNLVFYTNKSELFSEWNKYHFAITSGGNTLFERIISGTPGATLCQLSRQDQIANDFEKLGCNINLGMWNKINSVDIKKKLKILMSSPLIIPQEKINLDGKGGIRVAKNLLRYTFSEDCESNYNYC